jgi:hypothetical protein
VPEAAPQLEAAPTPQAEPEPEAVRESAPGFLPPEPAPIIAISREEMTEVLSAARTKVSVAPEPPAVDRNLRLRWLTIGALSLAVLLFCVGMTLGDTAGARVTMGEGVAHRHAASGTARLMALADSGDLAAQAKLALAYLRGGDSESAARWSEAAAEDGHPVAQYLAGALSRDKSRAVALFRAAAMQGNLKAMHNLAIAYAQGDGIARDEAQAAGWFARAAAHGYVDSAFDLAVMYERGQGVPQDLASALKWYTIAALAGDAPSQARAAFLRGQLKPQEALAADAAARDFTALPASAEANRL